MSRDGYLQRCGIDTDADISELSESEATYYALESVYYSARLSDSTSHGTNHGAKIDRVCYIVKNWPQFDHTDFEHLDESVDYLIDKRTA